MIRPEFIVEELRRNIPTADFDMVWKAYAFAARCHKGQKRVSGDPYLNHPLAVASILAGMKLGHVSISVGLLHDTIEDTLAEPEEIIELFGDEVYQIVEGVTKISTINPVPTEAAQAENTRKMILAMAKDIRVILVKLADRLHNMRTLHYLPPEKQKKIAQETLDIYAPLANRLGMGWIKTELENLSFFYLWPKDYREIKRNVETLEAEREKYLAGMVSELEEKLKAGNIDVTVTARPKHFYSIFRKMRRQNISFDEVYDIMGIRIVTANKMLCYPALGIVHEIFKPIPGKLKDYIALPKANFYQSIHTTVIAPGAKPVEIQIRSEEMDIICEEGIAAHWRYKENKTSPTRKAKEEIHDEQIVWLRRLLEWQKEVEDPKEFLEKVKIDLFPDEVYIFTPNQEVKSFPKGATPVDFAYAVHSDVGHHCIGAKVNGKLASLKQSLRNGDIVEILTSSKARPSRDWLKHVKTSKARTKISSFLYQAEKQRSIDLGHELLEKELTRLGLDLKKKMAPARLQEAASSVGHATKESLFSAIGLGRISISTVIKKIVPKEILEKATGDLKVTLKKPSAESVTGVRIRDVEDLLIRFAHCCSPVPGDDIIGFISRGRGLIVHTADCQNVKNLGIGPDSERRVNVSWDIKQVGKHQVMLKIVTNDKTGMLAKVSTAVAGQGSNITSAATRQGKDDKGSIYLTVEITDLKELNSVIQSIKKEPGVYSVDRIRDRKSISSISRA